MTPGVAALNPELMAVIPSGLFKITIGDLKRSPWNA